MTECDYAPDTLTCRVCGHEAISLPTHRVCKPPKKPREATPAGPPGPGHYLTRTLAFFEIHYTPDCPCKAMAAKMDRLGPDWCETPKGMAEILSVMRAEHKRRKMLTPWSDTAATWAVYAACALARRAARAAQRAEYTGVQCMEKTHGSGRPEA